MRIATFFSVVFELISSRPLLKNLYQHKFRRLHLRLLSAVLSHLCRLPPDLQHRNHLHSYVFHFQTLDACINIAFYIAQTSQSASGGFAAFAGSTSPLAGFNSKPKARESNSRSIWNMSDLESHQNDNKQTDVLSDAFEPLKESHAIVEAKPTLLHPTEKYTRQYSISRLDSLFFKSIEAAIQLSLTRIFLYYHQMLLVRKTKTLSWSRKV